MEQSLAVALHDSGDINNNSSSAAGAYVRFARNAKEVEEAQKLRYKVFYEEYGAKPDKHMAAQKRDFDDFDKITDHLIVLDRDTRTGSEKIVGTYRLLRQNIAKEHGDFYSSGEYNLDALVNSGQFLLELGRSCVLAEYRTKPVLNLLWRGIADYITDHKIDLLFGCASFQGVNIDDVAKQLSYLYHFHSTDEDIRPIALENRYVDMNLCKKESLDKRRIFASLPPLIKGYLRLGATIGEGAVVDYQFNTIDVCIVMQTSLLTDRYRKYYERKIQRTLPGQN